MPPGLVADGAALPLWTLPTNGAEAWRQEALKEWLPWLKASNFKGELGTFVMLPGDGGALAAAVAGLGPDPNLWSWAAMPAVLPAGTYALAEPLTPEGATAAALGWGLGTYRYDRFKHDPATPDPPRLVAPAAADLAAVARTVEATFYVRDLINRPANDLGPSDLAASAVELGRTFGAKVTVISGDALLKQGYPAIYAVGAAAQQPPCLIDLTWGESAHPKVTLVGKGVCFDSGGLNVKSLESMRLMKKDMGGAAVVLGVAKMIMDAGLKVRLRVLVPAVENAIASSSYRPGDIVPTRKGLSIEIVNTDAEGRVILADALTEADSERPDLLIECSTLTGHTKLALGNEYAALFSPDDALAMDLQARSLRLHDPMWRLPLVPSYRKRIESHVADLVNMPDGNYAGAITAALFLERFVTETKAWAHVDIFAWNDRAQPGRLIGAEATGMRAIYDLIESRFG